MDIFCIEHEDQIDDIADSWKLAYKNMNRPSIFVSLDYVRLWYRSFAKPQNIRIYYAKLNGRIVCILPLVLDSYKGTRILKSLNNDHCLHTEALVCENIENAFSQYMLDRIVKDASKWHKFLYSFNYTFLKSPEIINASLEKRSDLQWKIKEQPTYAINLPDSFESYVCNDLSDNTKRSYKRILNKLKRNKNWHFRHFRKSDAVDHFPHFLDLEDSGWKGRQGTSIKSLGKAYRKYYDGLVRLLAEKDQLHIYFLELEGKFIAGLFGYEDKDNFHMAKAAYNESFRKYSPANLLMLHIIQDLIKNNQKISRLHMFPWDYNYKHKYSNCNESCRELMIYSTSLAGKAAYAFDCFKCAIKPYVKKFS